MCRWLAIGPACKAPAVPVLDSYTADGGLSALHAVSASFTQGATGGAIRMCPGARAR